MKDTRPSFKYSCQSESSREPFKPPVTKEDSGRRPMPLITTEVMQRVQLRPVRKNSGARQHYCLNQQLRNNELQLLHSIT
jgi:hypothetical protein